MFSSSKKKKKHLHRASLHGQERVVVGLPQAKQTPSAHTLARKRTRADSDYVCQKNLKAGMYS